MAVVWLDATNPDPFGTPENRDIVERIVAERQAGASLYTIAHGLNADGISGSQGARWYASTVRHVLMAGHQQGQPAQPSAKPRGIRPSAALAPR